MPNPANSTPTLDPRARRARTPSQLKRWIRDYTGLRIPDRAVCPGHQSPWECFEAIHLGRPSLALVLGSRGSGKSFLSALDTHLTSRWDPDHGTRILGGSRQQSVQIYNALCDIATRLEGGKGGDSEAIAKIRKDGATYLNGSIVEILAASSTSVRGPHVPSLKLDEVDEIDVDIREAAMGMCLGRKAGRKQKRRGMNASAIMTSTCHRVNGPMARLVERAVQGEFPLYTMCTFEVLERCPRSRSGPNLEKCPECPLFRFCHDVSDGGPPKAKRSCGHYPIESLIQKVRSTSLRTFEADYLCKLSSSDSAWFPSFQPATHVTDRAEYLASSEVHLAVDSGVFTGAVFFQVVVVQGEDGPVEEVRVFADYLAENVTAHANARALLDLSKVRCNGLLHRATTDPAGKSRTPMGVTVLAEFFRAGLALDAWPVGKVSDGLALLDSFLTPAAGKAPRLLLHPRCTATIQALQCYRRAKRGGQWLDEPADPQHPYEDLVDALRGGLKAYYPEGRIARSSLMRVKASKVL